MPEQVAVVDSGAAAERAHRLAQLRLDERVDDDRGPARCARCTACAEVLDRLDARVPDLDERLVGELRLERRHEPRRRLAGRVGDDVQLHGWTVHDGHCRRRGP